MQSKLLLISDFIELCGLRIQVAAFRASRESVRARATSASRGFPLFVILSLRAFLRHLGGDWRLDFLIRNADRLPLLDRLYTAFDFSAGLRVTAINPLNLCN
jgi:hypothetical protein